MWVAELCQGSVGMFGQRSDLARVELQSDGQREHTWKSSEEQLQKGRYSGVLGGDA